MSMSAIPIYGGMICFLGIVLLSVVYYFWKFHTGLAVDYPTSMKLHQEAGPEKREHPRADVDWSAWMETAEGAIELKVKNISLGGAFLCCKKPLPLERIFSLSIMGPNNEPMEATAQVVWSNANVPEEKVVNRGMGVRFLRMSDKHIQLVRQTCQENPSSAPVVNCQKGLKKASPISVEGEASGDRIDT